MLKYDFEASMLSGTNYRLPPYVKNRGNRLIENLGNPMTLEVRWTYQRTIGEWLTELCSGENLLRTYDKKIQVIDQTSRDLPNDLNMVLVDANDNNRSYYADVSTPGVYATGSNNYLDLNKFTNGNDTFKSRQLNDFFSVTTTSVLTH